MQRKLSLFIVLVILLSLFSGCSFNKIVPTTNTVNFYVDGHLYDSLTVPTGSTVASIKAPEKENQIFVGWFLSPDHILEFDFSTKIILDIDLYAYYTIDAIATTKLMTNQIMKSVVTIENKSYNTGFGGLLETDSATSQGSGVIIDISGGYCYVLTNAHVVEKHENYTNQSITVEDAWGNEFVAKVYQHPECNSPAISNTYDLALICFNYNPNSADADEQLAEIVMDTNPAVDSYVVSLGSPLGQKNAITYGTVISYSYLQNNGDDDLANIDFKIIVHNAVINHGSSGGPLLNTSGKLVGLNFAGLESTGTGCAIPMAQITEFLNTYVYVK